MTEHISRITDDEGAKWEIYSVKAAAEGDTSVPVPKNYPYTVSGNNVDGFIVTSAEIKKQSGDEPLCFY